MNEKDINYNIAVFTTKQVLSETNFISYVYHDSDGDWQFFTNDEAIEEDNSNLVSLQEIIDIDNTIIEILDMPLGLGAYRKGVGHKWEFFQIE